MSSPFLDTFLFCGFVAFGRRKQQRETVQPKWWGRDGVGLPSQDSLLFFHYIISNINPPTVKTQCFCSTRLLYTCMYVCIAKKKSSGIVNFGGLRVTLRNKSKKMFKKLFLKQIVGPKSIFLF